MTQLPAKIPGRHRWCAFAVYTLTDDEAKAATGGEPILFGPNLVAFSVDCPDCNAAYPADGSCTAEADPELDQFTDDGVAFDIHAPGNIARLAAASDGVTRLGGSYFELGHEINGAPVHEARWWASAILADGDKVRIEGYADPVQAAEALFASLAIGTACARCEHLIALVGWPGEALPGRCLWHRDADRWVPSCQATS